LVGYLDKIYGMCAMTRELPPSSLRLRLRELGGICQHIDKIAQLINIIYFSLFVKNFF